MSEEKKVIELKEEDLEKVSGGLTNPFKETIQELENATYITSGTEIYYNNKTYYATSEVLENPATGNWVIVYVTHDGSEAKLFVRYQ